jgi:L-serine kinase (ADP)
MTEGVEFVLVPIDHLKPHEEVDERKVERLAEELRRAGVFVEPIWVARGSNVILNGHHRVAALRRLGAKRVPAWRVAYEGDEVRLDRWEPGPPISKEEVVRRAEEGRLFSPRTTKHSWRSEPPDRPTPLADLGVRTDGAPAHAGREVRPRATPRGSPPAE